ncbi:MAG TPA: hypothetical protein V6C52_07900 [Coleofasciculaceae cyanobacterium]|jgi:hypothetical protein
MRQLFSILGDSYVIWSRNFTLMYVVLFSWLLLNLVIPKGEMPSLDLRWGLLALVTLMMMAAIQAGWFNMIAKACIRYMDAQAKESQEPVSPLEAFTLFREFLPGISGYFPQFTLGTIVQTGVLLLFGSMAYPAWLKNQALFQELFRIATEGSKNLPMLSMAQQQHLGEFMLIMLLALLMYALFWLITMLWPAYVILYEDNALKACWRSFMQFLRDPFRLLAISGVFLIAQFLPALGLLTGDSLVAIVFHFTGMLIEIYAFIVMFVYVYQVVGKPIIRPEPENDDALPGGVS